MPSKKAHTALMKFGTIGKGGERRLLAAAKHNLREMRAHAADPSLSWRNEVLRGPTDADGVRALAVKLRDAAGYTRRRVDDTIAAEIVFSLPPRCAIVPRGYMLACLEWVDEVFGRETSFSAVIHLDEAAPHMHVLMLPAKHGTWLKSKVFGDNTAVKELQEDFWRRVASRFGLKRAQDKLQAGDRRALADCIVQHLKDAGDPCIKSAAWMLLREDIEADPAPYAEALGLDVRRTQRTMAQIFTSSGRGSKRREDESAIAVATQENRPLSCVAVGRIDHDTGQGATARRLELVPVSAPASVTGTQQDGVGTQQNGVFERVNFVSDALRGPQQPDAAPSMPGNANANATPPGPLAVAALSTRKDGQPAAAGGLVSAVGSAKTPGSECTRGGAQRLADPPPIFKLPTEFPPKGTFFSGASQSGGVAPGAQEQVVRAISSPAQHAAKDSGARYRGRLGVRTLRDRRRTIDDKRGSSSLNTEPHAKSGLAEAQVHCAPDRLRGTPHLPSLNERHLAAARE